MVFNFPVTKEYNFPAQNIDRMFLCDRIFCESVWALKTKITNEIKAENRKWLPVADFNC